MNSFHPHNEQELITALQRQDKEAFTYLYDSYSGALYGILLRTLKDRQLSEDALQEVFIKIWNSIKFYQPTRGRLFTWMVRITKNYAVDVLRSKAYKKYRNAIAVESELITATNTPLDRFDAIGIEKFLLQIPGEYRLVLNLFYLHGFSQEDIAVMQRLPLGTVKSRIRTALKYLRTIVKES